MLSHNKRRQIRKQKTTDCKHRTQKTSKSTNIKNLDKYSSLITYRHNLLTISTLSCDKLFGELITPVIRDESGIQLITLYCPDIQSFKAKCDE